MECAHALRFFKRKMEEYELLIQEIELLWREVMMSNSDADVKDVVESLAK